LLEKDPAKRIATALAVSNRLKAMEFALSMETRVAAASEAFDLAQDEEYQLADNGQTVDPQGATAETRVVTPEERLAADHADDLDRHRSSTVAMSEVFAPERSLEGQVQPSGSHFTTYDQAARRRATTADSAGEQVPWLWKIGPWLLAAAVIGIAIWYVSRPAGADVLLHRITEVAKEGETSDLTRVEGSIDEFLDRFPDHPQSGEIRALREELNLYRLQRRYERRARLRGGTDTLSPIERMYVETTRMAQSDPRGAAVKLRALVDVYAGSDTDPADQRCLMLAREQIEQLRLRADQVAAEDVAVIHQRLDQADSLRESDRERATSIRRGVIELYDDQPWARPVVERARAALESEPLKEMDARATHFLQENSKPPRTPESD
jgi:hypothetical protein